MEISSLVEAIKKDLARSGAYDRYPVRFFSMKYEKGMSDALIQLRREISSVDFLDIRSLLAHEDAWITTDRLVDAVRSLDADKSYILIGFSEYARFLAEDEFIALLISLLETENPAEKIKRRIYIPCFALYSQIKKRVKKFHRRYDTYDPFLNDINVEDLPKIYFVSDGIEVEDRNNILMSSAEWFGMWRNQEINPRTPIICMSKTLSYFYTKASPDNVYNIRQIKTYREYLQFMYNIRELHSYQKDPEKFYKKLVRLKQRSCEKSLNEMILSEINAQTIGEADIYAIWKKDNLFHNWLIQNYVLQNGTGDTYLYQVMDAVEKLNRSEFVKTAYMQIFESREPALRMERKRILESIKQEEGSIALTNQVMGCYNKMLCDIIRRKTAIQVEEIEFTCDNLIVLNKKTEIREEMKQEFIPYLTCFSVYERKLIIWLYRHGIIEPEETEEIYPELWLYINSSEVSLSSEYDTEKFDKYFKIYRECRLNRRSGEQYDQILREWNGCDNAFYSWYYGNDLQFPDSMLKRMGDIGTVYVLDGVGAEFLGYMVQLLKACGYTAKTSGYAKSHLPSTTSAAQEFYPSEYQWNPSYDRNVVHGSIYYHADNMEKALSFIKEMINEIISAEAGENFAIIADHGSSAGHKLWKKEKKYDFTQAEHDGRCWHNKERQHVEPSMDYIVHQTESGEEWVIALNQQSLYHNSKYAVHGGATPEEVLVPVIIAQRKETAETAYKVRSIDLKVSGIRKTIEVKITPNPSDTLVRLTAKDGTDTEMQYNREAKIWSGELKRGIKQDIEIAVGHQKFQFKTVSSMGMEDTLFDD